MNAIGDEYLDARFGNVDGKEQVRSDVANADRFVERDDTSHEILYKLELPHSLVVVVECAKRG